MVIVSGDGLVYEAIQGLMARRDYARLRTPLAVVAGGSGNGLARSLCHAWGHAYAPDNGITAAAVHLALGRVRPMDLFRITPEGGGAPVHAFLSFGAGLLADVDIESEVLRWMGEARFTLWAVLRLVRLRHYPARVSYLHGRACGRLCGAERGRLCQDPDCWTEVEGDFVLVYAVNQPYISGTALLAPRARMDDGLITLLLVRRGVTRAKLLRFLLGMETGAHASMREVEMVPVRAVRYRPLEGPRGPLTVDGELVDNAPFEAEVLPEHISVVG